MPAHKDECSIQTAYQHQARKLHAFTCMHTCRYPHDMHARTPAGTHMTCMHACTPAGPEPLLMLLLLLLLMMMMMTMMMTMMMPPLLLLLLLSMLVMHVQ